MTKKNYEAIAGVIASDIALYKWGQNNEYTGRPNSTAFLALRNTTLSLSDVFAQENERFDRAKFLTACGLTHDDAPLCIPKEENVA